MLNVLLKFIFSGFALYSIAHIISYKISKKENLIFNTETDNSAVLVVRIFGLFFFTLLAQSVLDSILYPDPEMGSYRLISRMFGPYWFGFWLYPFVYTFLTQLLWIKKLKQNWVFRIFLAFTLIFTVFLERIIIILVSLQRDYIPSDWSFSMDNPILNIILDLVYAFILVLIIAKVINVVIRRIKLEQAQLKEK